MGFLSKLLGKDKAASIAVPSRPPASVPATIRVYDAYGRPMEVQRESWRRDVLIPNFKQKASDPAALYGLIVQALNDGFLEDALEPAKRLQEIDPDPLRAACTHGVVLLSLKRYQEARQVMESAVAKHGEAGYVMTNIAKVYSGLGENERAERILWHALELDPNQDNGLAWYVSSYREREGEAGRIAAYQRVAVLTGSWRAQLWLARAALDRKDLEAARALYRQALDKLTQVPADVLMQISGDLGNHGHLSTLIEICRPRFDAVRHGLMVGNNLIKAYLDLKDTKAARDVLEQVYAQQRPDWREALVKWEDRIDEAEHRYGPVQKDALPLTLSLIRVEEPIWARGMPELEALLPAKKPDAPLIVFVCGSADKGTKNPDAVEVQKADDVGRASRALPLFFTEEVILRTEARSHFVLPWIDTGGFVVSGQPWRYQDMKLQNLDAQFVVMLHVDAPSNAWVLHFSVLTGSGGEVVKTWKHSLDVQNPKPAVLAGLEQVLKALGLNAGQAPEGFDIAGSDWLVPYQAGLEQALAVGMASLDGESHTLQAERSILDNLFVLAADTPRSARTRCLLINTLERESRRRPDIVREYWMKLERLQKERPLPPSRAADAVVAAVAKLAQKIQMH